MLEICIPPNRWAWPNYEPRIKATSKPRFKPTFKSPIKMQKMRYHRTNNSKIKPLIRIEIKVASSQLLQARQPSRLKHKHLKPKSYQNLINRVTPLLKTWVTPSLKTSVTSTHILVSSSSISESAGRHLEFKLAYIWARRHKVTWGVRTLKTRVTPISKTRGTPSFQRK